MSIVLSPLVDACIGKLLDLAAEKGGMILGVKDELMKLQRRLVRLSAFLEDAEKKSIEDKSIKNWLGELKDVVYDADNILDLCRVHPTRLLEDLDQQPPPPLDLLYTQPLNMSASASASGSEQRRQKKKRGPTTMDGIPKGHKEKLQVDFNQNGQPFGTNSEKFVSYLGVITRQHVPIVIDWKDLEEEKWTTLKDDIWSLIQQYFIVDDVVKDNVFKMMGKYWRQYKSKITKDIFKANELPNKVRALQLIKPSNVKSNKDWDNFVKERLATSFQAKREKFSAMRKKQKFTHTMSRKGFARLENEMEEIKKQKEVNENPPSKSIRDDALARVLGPEARGRVRGLGFGATPTKVDAIVQGNARIKDLEVKLKAYDDRMASFEAKLQEVMKQKNSGKNVDDMLSSQVATPNSEQASHQLHCQANIQENAMCQILNWENFEIEEVVAEGHIASVDPRTKVHHMTLGRDCWKVWVDTIFDEDLKLYRATDEFSKLGDTLGSTIAWPKSSIKLL